MEESMRGISLNFINDLKTGTLSKVLERVKADGTLMLEIRQDYTNIYYRGGNILRISEKSLGNYEFSIDYGYIVDNSLENILQADFGKNSNASSIDTWLNKLPNIKDQMDLYFGTNSRERDYQQLVVLENNYGSSANDTDYYICDIEYANFNGRFDMIAVRWPSTGPDRRRNKDLGLAFIEMKYMDKALTGQSGLLGHITGMNAFLSNPQNVNNIRDEMKHIFNQKVDLGLLQDNKRIGSFSLDKPEYILILANHDPAKSALYRELQSVINLSNYASFCNKADLKIAMASFMGYGLYDDYVLDVTSFIKQNFK